jgi:hypothetical protein
MTENGIEAYLQYACRIAASGAVPRHINFSKSADKNRDFS